MTASAQATILYNEFENYAQRLYKISLLYISIPATSSRGLWEKESHENFSPGQCIQKLNIMHC